MTELSNPLAAGLLLTLKAECEAQHARAEAANLAVGTLQTALRQLVVQWRERASEWEIVWSAGAPGLEEDLLPSGAYRKAADELAALLPALELTP